MVDKQIKRKLFKRVKTPTLLQMETVECGVAALGIILSYYGRIVLLAELRREFDCTSALSILMGGRRYGMKGKTYKMKLDYLQRLKPPYIVFWNFDHFLVVEGFSKERVYLNDPATGRRSVSLQEFDQAYTGYVLVLETGKEFKKEGGKPSLKSKLICFLPEEYIAELEALHQQLKFEQCFNWVIHMIMFKNILELFWALYVQINIDNFWLPQHRKTPKH